MQALSLDRTFQALADPTRRALLSRLAMGPATVSELSAPFRMSQPAISRHLKVLEEAGLIATRIDGSRRPRSAVPGRLREVRDWLAEIEATFETNYRRLDAVLQEMEGKDDV